jgi:hypothetical protein
MILFWNLANDYEEKFVAEPGMPRAWDQRGVYTFWEILISSPLCGLFVLWWSAYVELWGGSLPAICRSIGTPFRPLYIEGADWYRNLLLLLTRSSDTPSKNFFKKCLTGFVCWSKMLYMEGAQGANKQGEAKMSNNNAYNQAVAQANSIAAMVAALNADYDRLEELKNERHTIQNEGTIEELAAWDSEYSEELQELDEAANGNESEDDARERIQEDALDVQVRSGWHSIGGDDTPSEFQILLCTGGPAVRIMGELNDFCEPSRAWIEAQDWGTPWFHCSGIIDQETLLTYCRQFYFGE